jgi:hypothetical protein
LKQYTGTEQNLGSIFILVPPEHPKNPLSDHEPADDVCERKANSYRDKNQN